MTKLVLPVAGLGKRLLPLTKKTPKNLIPVNHKPLLQYVLEEAVSSGIREVILIVNPLHRKQFERYLVSARKRFPGLRFFIREQATPGGNGHAIAQAYDLIGNHPFAVRFCDDVIVSHPPVLQTLLAQFDKLGRHPLLLLERVPKSLVSRFGVVAVTRVKGSLYQIRKIVEKPKPADAPSNLTIVGGYVLTPHIVRNLKMVADTLPVIADDALPLAVALQIQLIVGGKVYGWEFDGRRLDCGTLEKLQKAEHFLKNHPL